MATQTSKFTALYCRLSDSDDLDGLSNSIQNQQTILLKFAETNGFTNTRFFVDDGVTGTVFRRPGLDAMLEEVKAGNIATVIIKDQSRIGRDVLEIGLLKRTFEEHNVRFIAANDNLDTAKGFDIMSIFRDVFNEWFVADTSKKIRAVKRANGEKGMHGSMMPYGYRRKEGDKTVMLIDEEVADNVREIFRRIVAGDSAASIAKDFNSRGIYAPRYYARIKKGKDISGEDTRWFTQTVTRLTRNPTYIGTFVCQQLTTVSYKNRTQVKRPKEEWIVIENHHPPLVEREHFEIVQQLIERRRRATKSGDYGALNGLAFCAKCDSPLRYSKGEKRSYYTCSLYASSIIKFGRSCTRHGVRREALEAVTLDRIQWVVAAARENKAGFIERILETADQDSKKALKRKAAELTKAERRILELDKIIKRIYEDNIAGRISDDRFNKLLEGYETEQATLVTSAETLKAEVVEIEAKQTNVDAFMSLIERYTEVPEITATVAREFIRKIVVHEAVRMEGSNKVQSQTIDIYFNHIGKVDGI